MKILCVDSNHHILHETLRAAGFQCDLFWDKPVDELLALLPSYDGLVIRSRFKLTRQILENCPRLKCIGRVGAGMENIDVAFAEHQGIVCVCVPEGNRDAVGEHAIGMLLMLLNRLKKADAEVRNGVWLRAENRGTEIKGKTVGIIGYGHMGSAFASKLRGFECEILAYDKYWKGFGNEYVTEASLQELFTRCDIVSLHVPLTPETKFMINADFLSSFSKKIWLINTARGQCLNSADLVEAMENGKVMGACLDVLEYEAVSFEHVDLTPPPLKYLLASDRVVLSPHIAGWTHESNYRMSLGIAVKMKEVLEKLR
jgi:D-3-phosphoglycerate dehydrogenase